MTNGIRSANFRYWTKFLRFSSVVVITFLMDGCHHHETDVQPTPVYLVNSTKTRYLLASDFNLYLGLSGLNISPSSLKYAVSLYKVTYNTTFQGNKIVASGLVALPDTDVAVGMISFQHGTIASHAEAPSIESTNSEDVILYAALASPGLIAVVPDYVGFGASSSVVHPYFVRDATSIAVVDLLKAAKELAILKNVKFDGKLFLAGYSEGGYATMATHRAIEQTGLEGFTLTASFPASGGYDVKGMQEYFFGLTTYDDPFFLAYVEVAYQSYYGWNEPITNFFQQPYATIIPGLFDGSRNGSQIDAELTDTIANLVAPGVLANIDSDEQYRYIVNAFEENSLLDWKPTVNMFMYHGDADITVPYQNSVNTYNHLIANGASAEVLTLTPLVGKTHGTGVLPYIDAIFPKILSLQ